MHTELIASLDGQALPLHLAYEEFPSAHEIRPAELAHTVAWLQGLYGAV